MDRETARQIIRENWRKLGTPDGSGKGIVCHCGSGQGTKGTGIKENPGAKERGGLKCFACGWSGDIIDLIQITTGKGYNDALQYAADMLNITIDPPQNATGAVKHAQNGAERNERERTQGKATGPQSATNGPTRASADYTDYYRKCAERLQDPAARSYLLARGISLETAEAHGLGYDPMADPARSNHPTPRIIIPTSKGHYIGRSIDPDTPKAFAKLNNKGGTPDIFNRRRLWEDTPGAVFVVEGWADALSLEEVGAAAIALNSTSNTKLLLSALEKKPTKSTLIISLDNDQGGKAATEELRNGLQRLNISYITADICGGCKDANEALIKNRAAFAEAVNRQRQIAEKPDNISRYIADIMTGEIAQFREAGNRKTGFDNLDKLAGGLYNGLYVVAAITSLGKTTFCHQLADNLATAGEDVIFFSLEQSRLELVSKSIARQTALSDIRAAVSSLSIRRGYLTEAALNAAEKYQADVGDRLSIVEGNFNCNLSFIGDYTRKYIRDTGKRPTLIIDYLQILQGAADWHQSAKEQVDSTVTELKRLSRELNITVIAISSVNRANYLQPIDFESLKESGSVEFTADVIWGLQLQCLNDPLFDKGENIKIKREKVREAKAANPRKIELLCLKNRYGIANYSAYFNYYPNMDLFTVCPETDLGFNKDEPQRKAGRKM